MYLKVLESHLEVFLGHIPKRYMEVGADRFFFPPLLPHQSTKKDNAKVRGVFMLSIFCANDELALVGPPMHHLQ